MKSPFVRPLVPYDGSAPSHTALVYGIDLAQLGAHLTVATIVDEMPLIAQSSASIAPIDPGPLLAALESDAEIELDKARARCDEANVAADLRIVHDRPVAGIVSAARQSHADVVIMGTHGRDGWQRTLLGSVTEGVLRSCDIPVLAMNTVGGEHVPATIRRILVAIDDSDPSDAALDAAIAAARTVVAALTICTVIDTRVLFERAGTYGYDPAPLVAQMRAHAEDHLSTAVKRLDQYGVAVETLVVEGEPASALVAAATSANADLITIGSHGRRGLRRFFLGSVAESVVRHSMIPVLVVRDHLREQVKAPPLPATALATRSA